MRTAEPPRIIPPHNLFGDHGPLCPHCSGLGSVLKLPVAGGVTRSASRCSCRGTGVDQEAVMRQQISALVNRLERQERTLGRQAHLLRELRAVTKYDGKMSRQSWEELIHCATTDGTAVANSVAETIIMPNITMPGNYMQDGRALRLKVAGKYSTLGSGTVTLVFRVRWGGVGGTLLAATGTVTLLISMTNALWDVEVMIQTRVNGSSGTLLVDGICHAFGGTAPTIGSATGAPAVAPMTAGGQTAPAGVGSLDLTADTALAVTVQHGAASASNTATGMHYTLESLN